MQLAKTTPNDKVVSTLPGHSTFSYLILQFGSITERKHVWKPINGPEEESEKDLWCIELPCGLLGEIPTSDSKDDDSAGSVLMRRQMLMPGGCLSWLESLGMQN